MSANPKTRTLTVQWPVQLPIVPNYLLHSQEGAQKVDIAHVSDDGLREIGQAWTEALIARATERRAEEKRQAR